MEGGGSPGEPGPGPGGRFPAERSGSCGTRWAAPRGSGAASRAEAVKVLGVPRYKMVLVAHVGQLGGQSLQMSSRSLWDPRSDTFSSCVFKNSSLFAVANVCGVYFE